MTPFGYTTTVRVDTKGFINSNNLVKKQSGVYAI